MKRQSIKGLAFIAVAGSLLTSCDLLKDLDYKVTPSPLEMHGDSVKVRVDVTFPEKGMLFLDGNSKDNWRWAAVNSIEILEEEKAKFPKGQTTKMDMKNIQHFEKEDFMEALDAINFFDVEVVDKQ